tara:strand:+ start:193 stop:324 length:132 start_codon:yes stop_codon:yes gene_type:complete
MSYPDDLMISSTGEPMPTESGTSVRAIATNAQFRVLRRTGGAE